MAAGCPVVYPEESAYFEQVFHAGMCYSRGMDAADLVETAGNNAGELRSFARIPSQKEVVRALGILLQT